MSAREKEEVGKLMRGWFTCERLGGHLFKRDYVLGIFPVGHPYCIRCGTSAPRAVK